MSNVKFITPEEVDSQIAELQKKHGAKAEAMSAQAVNVESICAVILIATPILKFIRSMLFWKPKWQAILDQVIGATAVCGGA